MACSIDLCRLFDRSMVEPENDVTVVIEFRTSDGNRFVGIMRENSKGAGGIEGQTADSGGVNVMLVQNAVD